MKHYSLYEIKKMERHYRGHLINSITGFKSANLLATRSEDGVDNVAIFSSVTHLGSDPALFGYIQRPLGHGAGHTYENLKATNSITLNHINMDLVDAAHQSSAKYDPKLSEFDLLGIERFKRDGFKAPFVKYAHVQVAATYENEYYLKENDCRLVICRITDIFLAPEIQTDDGWVNLDKAGTVTINGLDAYATATVEKRLSYAKVDQKLEEIEIKK
ncbi:flavin reductase family protein [Nonlabens ponticola]|uniref:Flavin oxidoreductase n=1 Tax=Nonlabens ponticola TaxID=2496866 RepID=A0A3S9MXH2_9FLAO|nr:flavin reductase [Nonlabens ponticola]AZQ43838.1 flavin oxidoreductase [Nonlabens ponticola]